MVDAILDVAGLPKPDDAAGRAAQAREAVLTKPLRALGRLEELTAHLCAWQGRHPPIMDKVEIHVFAGRHGVTAQNISAFPASVTDQMVVNFQQGGAAINQLAAAAGAGLTVHDPFVGHATRDWTEEEAMDPASFRAAVDAGRAAVGDGVDLIAIGEMGIGNTTTAAALCAALFGGGGLEWSGAGTGLSPDGVRHKAKVIERALARHKGRLRDPVEILRILGGFELAAMAGCILEARRRRVPVVLDGFVVGAAAAVLFRLAPDAIAHCLAGHVSAEHAHRGLLARMGLVPILDLDMRLGEASGAALAISVIRAAMACHLGMATFAEAGVAGKL
ncbi:MAG TPA: nicotinate-nucleotide--dimethylbenzimidazole phosphoribosyltransferase [Geminicoccus sp.]|uniref:nicotinate-nucleotide--dimethylbenzimidazole phosphoribosyltransferase n=1 Tax=Geminicoccus sp. TaxID=2024832 RepID=UPI002E33D5F8|nr:nicotinate-nucleotide--dimethylbenzimidazole phosphoribosyltransferase [Geminicoccus sp.]HEX2525703.1 nicotinate-nucleotide--dimethylbenzimidazole phosphoribosyltransferase [Geminicoccus sp.]